MKACKEFLAIRGLNVRKVFRVPSKSKKGKFHIVELLGNGTLRCSCIAGKMKKFCSHKQDKAEELIKKGFLLNEEYRSKKQV